MKFLITGTAGFIGYHLARRLLADGHAVTGFDGLTPYYDVRLKEQRHRLLAQFDGFRAVIGHLEDAEILQRTAAEAAPEIIVHLAAQAGVRYSRTHPDVYLSSNLIGTHNLLEVARAVRPRHLLFASSSSVYGANTTQPFAETDRTDFPISIYAATKRGAEALTHTHSHHHSLPVTCLRFFTVYGPWGRPDMALFRFVEAIENGEAIEVYGEGAMTRDFTYIDDLVEAVTRLAVLPRDPGISLGAFDSLSPVAPWRTVNIANGRPVALLDFIAAIERATGKTALRNLLPMQPGDVAGTASDITLLRALIGDLPATPLDQGVSAFVDWYRSGWAAPDH